MKINRNYMFKSLLLAATLIASNALFAKVDVEKPLFEIEKIELNDQVFELIESQNVPLIIVAANVVDTLVVYNQREYGVVQNGVLHKVQESLVNPLLKGVSSVQLLKFMEKGEVVVNQMADGQFSLNPQIRGLGGGALCANIVYWIIKTVSYGTAVAAAGSIVAVTGGVAGGVSGTIAASATLGASSSASVLGGAIAGYGLTTQATVLTAGAVSVSGGVSGTMALIETVALSAWAAVLLMPIP